MKPFFYRSAFAAGFFLAAISTFATVSVGNLRCESLENPLGIDATQPRLSWQLSSDERGQKQTAYEILVASSGKNLAKDKGDLWDSGKISSDESIQVDYAGQPLESRAQCFWKVRVWDKDGKVSGWSKPALWTMGLLHAEDWQAKWIGRDGADVTDYMAGANWIWFPSGEPEKSAAPGTNYFRRVVTIPAGRTIKSACFQYTGDNEGRGWIGQFDLGARNNYRTVKFNDITTRLDPGQTYVFGLTGYHNHADTPAGVVGLLEIEFTEGEPLIIPTDESWKVSDKEIPGWLETNFDDSAWVAAKKIGPVGMEPWGNVRVAETRVLPARYLRKEFPVEKKIKYATVSFSGLGLSELYLNGEKVGDHVLSPAFAQYNKREFYVTYDVTKQLQRGTNALGVILGNGRFYADRSKVYAGTVDFCFPKLLLNLHIEYADGSTAEIVSDESWKLTTDGPILANNDYDGEEYDARKEFSGWSKPGFDDSKWQTPQIVSAPGGVLSAEMSEPIRVTGTLQPISVTEIKPGVYIYDMGQNMVGWCRLHVSGPAGTRIILRHAETLKPDGSLYTANLRGARQTDSYILKGGGEEVWEPRFTSHGFRYVELTGFPGKPDLNSIEGRVVNDDLPTAGEFECSNELINQIYRTIVWGVRGNYRSIPTDCPQRDERQGWLGDRSEESRGETFSLRQFQALCEMDAGHRRRATYRAAVCRTSRPPTGRFIPMMWSGRARSSSCPKCCSNNSTTRKPSPANYDTAKKWMDYMSHMADERNHFARQLRRLVRAAGRIEADPFQRPEPHYR